MGKTLEEIKASRPVVDYAKMRATTEADIRRHMIEDGSDPAAPLGKFVLRRPGERGPGKRPAKVQLTLRVDPDVVAALKATGEGWMTRAAAVLSESVAGSTRQPEPAPPKQVIRQKPTASLASEKPLARSRQATR